MGDDWEAEWAREQAEEEADRQRKAEPAPPMSREDFLAWRAPREARTQAARLDNPLWHWLVRTRWSAYRANEMHAGPSSFDAGPMWCFDRFGKSETVLPDGRTIHIGGEHEDDYDPDFCIFNDVVVIGPGGDIAIYGYPFKDFPPTDFHSATLVDGAIIIIGCLGYPDQRVADTTPVYRLALDSMHIARMDAHGESPGWIYKHSARLQDDGRTIVVSGGEILIGNDRAAGENIDTWSLDTLTWEWQRLTRHDWQRWTTRRRDRGRSRLSRACTMTVHESDRFRSLRLSTCMDNILLIFLRAIATLATVSVLGLAAHYHVRPRLIAHSTVMIEPGKWMWVECGTQRFAATIEDVSMTGIVVHAEAGRPTGMPCEAAGVTARGNRTYFMPFRTVLGLAVGERLVWSNPFSM